MDCFCGCGARVPRDLIGLNVRGGEVAYELLAWDKYRTTADREPADALATERLVDRGAACFARVLATVHGERETWSLSESGEWLEESRGHWLDRPEMTEKGSFLRGPKLRVTEEDISRLDRVHPERSFSATATSRETVPTRFGSTNDTPAPDVAGQLERLGTLRAEGVLTEEEFRAAKARVLGTVEPPTSG
jgi:Short C-terminal domain